MPLFGLNQSDVAALQRIMDKVNGNIQGTPVTRLLSGDKFVQEEDHQAPEFYVAWTPDGITALDDTVDPPVPGTDDCDIYQLTFNGTDWELVSTEGTQQVPVFNISSSDISAETYILIAREKYGQWIAIVGGGSAADIIEFTIDSMECADNYANATAVTAVCSGTLPNGTLKIYDDLGCMFSFPEAQLIGASGYAIKMDGPGSADPSTTDCHWAVLALCADNLC